MPLISIIVPVYNVEKYLEKCILSILDQTLADFELILIDDGSTDKSGEICDMYQEKDSRIRVIHKTNGGLSSARNAGLDIATGKYIGFVDSDDYIAEDMYEFLYRNIIKEGADISCCTFYRCFKNKIITPSNNFYLVYESSETALCAALERKYLDIPVWNYLYKKELFNSVRFPINRNYEDIYILTDIFHQCSKIVSSSEAKYYYRNRDNSITKSITLKNINDLIFAHEKTYYFIQENYPSLSEIAFAQLCNIYRQSYNLLQISQKEDFKNTISEVLNFLFQNKKQILSNIHFTFLQILAFRLLFFHIPTYNFCIKLKLLLKTKDKLF